MTGLLTAERIEVHGLVQGVGFRPFVYGLAVELGLCGQVGNDSAKVFIDVAGPADAIERFVDRLAASPPPLARIDRLVRAPNDPDLAPTDRFRIVESQIVEGERTPVPADVAVCADCLAELFDPDDRRFHHPFITCTNCGPRFTIVTALPYDRPNTTMRSFPLCADCESEYHDPADRRYHAQPISCHRCGPTLMWRSGSAEQGDPISLAAAALARDEIIAVKGLGGYHLACDATSEEAVTELRRRKHRTDKPLAVMVADVAAARGLAEVTGPEATLLTSAAAPIVLLRSHAETALAPSVAPANPLVGVMVAYTPLHHLLLSIVGRPLVMTSANRSGEPIAWTPERLGAIDDLFDAALDHDRPVHQPCDDSVVRVVGDRLLPLRRARGYSPLPIAFPHGVRSALACGAELKNTFCAVDGRRAWLSQHIGDMENLATLDAFSASVEHYLHLYDIAPEVVAADAHPGYLSSSWARRNHGERLIEVQHHHAHVAAVMAEHQLDPDRPVLGFAFDGTGYGADGAIWGGEVLSATAAGFERLAHLAPIPLPGGDAAIREPARVALSHLRSAGIAWSEHLAPVRHLGSDACRLLGQQLDRGLGCIPTTSMGRLFDAVASLIGLRHEISFEAQAAIDLEIAAAEGRDHGDQGYRFELGGATIGPTPVLAAIVADLGDDTPTETIAWRFHRAVVDAVERLAVQHLPAVGGDVVALTGGVFQNALLTELTVAALEHRAIQPLTHGLVPPNDGGLALGQAFVAAHRSIHFDQTSSTRLLLQEP